MVGEARVVEPSPDRAAARPRRRFVRSIFRRARRLSLRSRVVAALLTVIVVSETAIVVSFYNQHKQHSINAELVSVAQRMHEIGDLEFGAAQLALQSSPASTQQIAQLRSMLVPSERLDSGRSAAERMGARQLDAGFALLARARAEVDRLPASSPRRAVDRRLMAAQARSLTALAAAQVHNEAESRIRSARASADTRDRDAFRTLVLGSGLSVLAAVALALLLAGTITLPVARLARAARHLGAGRLDYRLPVESSDEIGALATEFNRMAAQLQDASATLEDRVRQRTQELAEANRQLDVHRAEQERLAQQRRMLLGRVITAHEEERQRIARELHDETGQSLTALALGIEAATTELHAGLADSVDERLGSLTHVAADALKELERLVLDLRPAQLDRLGLVATLRWYVARVRSHSGVAASLTVHGQTTRLAVEVETALFRLAQEALTNVVRHAHADHADVRLSFEHDSLRLEVTDDGIGFDAGEVASAPTSIGLIGMRERTQLIGGSLTLVSRPGEGTHVSLTVPSEASQA
jgi:signal transduction histidine kinase